MNTPLVFSHANGIPAKTYQKFFDHLEHCAGERQLQIKYIPALGIGKFPVDRNWHSLAQELINFIQNEFSGPVTAIGHSLGGALGIFASLTHPKLFHKVIAIDPPLIGPGSRWAVGLLRLLRMEHLVFPLPQRAEKRRSQFHTREEALHYFKRKDLFKNFHPQCLQDYIQYALTPTENHFELLIPPRTESKIFRLMPCFFLPPLFRAKSCTIFYSSQNGIAWNASGVKWLGRVLDPTQLIPYEGGHMAPLETPKSMAQWVYPYL